MQVGIVFRIPIAVNIYSCILLKCLHDLIIPILTRQLTGTNVLTVSCACVYYSIYRTGFFLHKPNTFQNLGITRTTSSIY